MINFHKQSHQLNNDLNRYLPGSLHYNFNFLWEVEPIHFKSGRGHFLFDIDNNEYIDFFSKFGALILGHSNKSYIESLSSALDSKLTAVDHIGIDELDIIKKLVSYVEGAEQVRFSLSGSEAVQNALRISRAYTGKNKIIRFIGHYHGSFDNVLGGFAKEKDWYVPKELQNDPRGTSGRAENAFVDTILIPWNNPEVLHKVFEHYAGDIAAVIMEPICINGGGIFASNDYYATLRKITKINNALLIFDEVITGFRLKFGSAQSLINISPDIWIFGKAIGGGSLPISCVMSNNDIMSLYNNKSVTHGGTFNGYPLGLYAIGSTLDILSDNDNIYSSVIDHADNLKKIILEASYKYSIPLVIQGHAMAMVLHANDTVLNDPSDWSSDMKIKEEIIRNSFLEHGIILAPPCRIYPNIFLNESVVNTVASKIDNIFNSIKKEYAKKRIK